MGRPGEDKFTDSLKRKLEGYEPAFNEKAWGKMSARLSSQSSAPVWLKPWLYGLGCGLIIMLTLYYTTINSSDTAEHIELNAALSKEVNELKKEVNKLKQLQAESKEKAAITSSNSTDKNKILFTESQHKPIIKKEYIFIEPEIQHPTSGRNTGAESTLAALPIRQEIIQQEYKLQLGTLNTIEITPKSSQKEHKKTKRKFQLNWPQIDLKQQKNSSQKFTGPNTVYLLTNISNENNLDSMSLLNKAIGIGVSGNISPRLNLSGGINYGSSYGDHSYDYTSYKWVTVDDSTFVQNSVDSTLFRSVDWQYLDIPLQLKYQLYEANKHSISLSLGTVARFYLSEKYTSSMRIPEENPKSQTTELGAFENIHPLAKLNFGISYAYQLNKRWNLELQPYYSLSMQKHSFLKVKSKSYGLNFKVGYRFNKQENSRNP
ncbi:porin family protein [Labilibacter marinus]|uniref:outer membrane beta-barrel protein n=1 Tax=Labilibacter marinus TaxID=1477105 RepID=UPI00094F5519|nr:outer membrane beta-barrel protein [Labilibacter marinus]